MLIQFEQRTEKYFENVIKKVIILNKLLQDILLIDSNF